VPSLTHEERAVLAEVHRADAEEGGLAWEDLDELGDEPRAALVRLVTLGLVEDKGDYVRITAAGVDALRPEG
jgi:hypothetical protein